MLGPNITGEYIPVIATDGNGLFNRLGLTENEHAGCFSVSWEDGYGVPASGIRDSTDKKPTQLDFNASLSNGIYSKSTVVQPNSLNVQYLIKY